MRLTKTFAMTEMEYSLSTCFSPRGAQFCRFIFVLQERTMIETASRIIGRSNDACNIIDDRFGRAAGICHDDRQPGADASSVTMPNPSMSSPDLAGGQRKSADEAKYSPFFLSSTSVKYRRMFQRAIRAPDGSVRHNNPVPMIVRRASGISLMIAGMIWIKVIKTLPPTPAGRRI